MRSVHGRGGRRSLGCALLAGSLLVLAPASAGADLEPAGQPVGPAESHLAREDEPVILAGSRLSEMLGRPLADFALFRYNASTLLLEPVPFQIDQRLDRVFSPGSPTQFTENIYDVYGEDDGTLDADDELVFLFRDAGPAVGPGVAWPSGADTLRYEISITDARPGAPPATRWVYLFTGPGLPRSPVSYVSWDLSRSSSISTPVFALDYTDRWLLTGYRVHAPCGSGTDLIDRAKGRAGMAPNNGETEQDWNLSSAYLGGLSGPIRAIRYVRGAMSGFNTIHHDIVYRRCWVRKVNLRVHPVSDIWFYYDWLPEAGATLFTPVRPGGIPVDGVPDQGVPETPVPWSLRRAAGGGVVSLYDVPPSPYYAVQRFFYLDNAAYNDAPIGRPNYYDEDDSAYGDTGLSLGTLTGSETKLIFLGQTNYALCGNEGDAAMGEAYEELRNVPLQSAATPQWSTPGAVRSLRARPEGADVRLDWQSAGGASGYRIYAAGQADLPHVQWTLLDDTSGVTYADPGACESAWDRYYSVVAYGSSGEGPW